MTARRIAIVARLARRTLMALFFAIAFLAILLWTLPAGADETRVVVAILAILGLGFCVEPIAGLLVSFVHRIEPESLGLSRARSLDLYREQAEFAWADGQLTVRERGRLEQLQARLGLSAQDAKIVEDRILGRLPPAERTGESTVDTLS